LDKRRICIEYACKKTSKIAEFRLAETGEPSFWGEWLCITAV